MADKQTAKIAALEERLHATREATVLQAKEYERRLDALNGEAERLKHMQATYLPREVFDARQRELNLKIDVLTRLVYIGCGVVLAIQLIWKFIK